MNPGILVAILTLVAFVAMGLYLTLTANKIQFPPGTRHSTKVAGVRLSIIFDGTLHFNSDTQKLHIAHIKAAFEAVEQVWLAQGLNRLRSVHPHIVVSCRKALPGGMHGLQTYARGKIGNEMLPMLLIETDTYAPRTASLVIHEMMHLLSSQINKHPDVPHVSTTLWADRSQESAEVVAQTTYALRAQRRGL